MDDSAWKNNFRSMMGHDKQTEKKRKKQAKARKAKLSKQQSSKSNQSKLNHKQPNSSRPENNQQKQSQPGNNKQNNSRPQSSKPESNNTVDHKINQPQSSDDKDGQLPWGLTLSVESISILTALKKAYGLNNRDDAFKLLITNSLHDLVNKNADVKKKYKLFKETYKIGTIPHAKKRWKHVHFKNKK